MRVYIIYRNIKTVVSLYRWNMIQPRIIMAIICHSCIFRFKAENVDSIKHRTKIACRVVSELTFHSIFAWSWMNRAKQFAQCSIPTSSLPLYCWLKLKVFHRHAITSIWSLWCGVCNSCLSCTQYCPRDWHLRLYCNVFAVMVQWRWKVYSKPSRNLKNLSHGINSSFFSIGAHRRSFKKLKLKCLLSARQNTSLQGF